MNQQDNSTTTSGQALSLVCTPELQGVGASEQRSSFYVMASITAPEFRAEKRAPVDMICVIDRSGSMSGDRIDMAKSTVEFVVANLQRDDRLGIVTYDDTVANHFPLRPMTADGKEAALAAIKAICVGGSTNLCGGLVEGVNQMRSREAGPQTNQVASVLLFTDGQANAGYTQAEDIIKATINADHASGSSGSSFGGRYGGWGAPPRQQQRFTNAYMPQQQQQVPISYGVPQQQSLQPISYGIPQQQQQQLPVALQPVAQAQNPTDFGGEETAQEEKKKVCEDLPLPCTINTFGFGADHDAALLKKIADHGQGIYYYIDSTKAIAEAFADCLGGLLSVVAQNIRVSFEVPAVGQAPVRINRVLTKFRSTEIEAGRAYELALGDIQSEERRDILVELSIANTSDVDAVMPVLKTTVTYTNVITGQQSASAEATATVRRPALPTGETRDYAVDRQLNRLLAAEAMEQANEAARDGEMERAREIIKRASGRIAESVSRDDEFCKSLVSDLQRCEGGLQSQSSWASTGGKMLTNQMQAHYVQRSTNVGWAGQASYQTSTRDRMQCNFKNS